MGIDSIILFKNKSNFKSILKKEIFQCVYTSTLIQKQYEKLRIILKH